MAGFFHPFLPLRLNKPGGTQSGFRFRPFVAVDGRPGGVQAGFRGIYPFITINGGGDFIPPPPERRKGGGKGHKDDEELLMIALAIYVMGGNR